MYRIIILEDEAAHARQLESLLRAYEKKQADVLFDITHYDSSLRLQMEYTCNADLLFMDIQMPGENGLQTAQKIREVDPKVMIIFTTAAAQYALAGYEVQAFDYMLKPLKAEMFEAKLNRALRVLGYNRHEEWIDVSSKTEVRRVPVSHITYIEVANHDILIHTKNDVYRHWGSLKKYEEQLAPAHFARCNACYLVNMKHVQSIGSTTVQVGSDELSVSKAKHKEFLVAFAKYKGGSQ